ncbi:type I restriction-modification system subunit M N-terminal domain-containing protein [Helicobacter sp. NHP22-001]|uniref:type I restriction-modification system subunit M N-terminal domain-containing protein n=1 Tax=Helicobacter sp. NHP22-001 TaxID=3040202 RepID=UPI00244D9733|nr:type I restriction-modification system subunit M N-terminal domain-containing protein [Helicobacter sp. NHP22-001]GMB96460.1 hypothetical protein NHP22001_10490 [Helicobacter sp. NHP22-001]
MDGTQFQPIVNFIWNIADLLRDHYTKGKYRDVILPMTVIRRLDAVLEPTKVKVLQKQREDEEQGFPKRHKYLCKASGFDFYNTSHFTLKELTAHPAELKANFKNYLEGFSPNVKDILEKFKFEVQLDTLDKAGILFELVQEFCSTKVNFSISPVLDNQGKVVHQGLSNLGMGYVFEELIRKANLI